MFCLKKFFLLLITGLLVFGCTQPSSATPAPTAPPAATGQPTLAAPTATPGIGDVDVQADDLGNLTDDIDVGDIPLDDFE